MPQPRDVRRIAMQTCSQLLRVRIDRGPTVTTETLSVDSRMFRSLYDAPVAIVEERNE
jgi:hypothetical protein